jgi:tetratricopeptide (TPR) repeat protein
VAVADELIAATSKLDEGWYLQWAVGERAVAALARDEWDDALAGLEESIRLGESIDANQAPYVHGYIAWLHRARGDLDRALDVAQHAFDDAARAAHAWWTPWTAAMLAWTHLDRGDPAMAIPVLQHGAMVGRDAPSSFTVRLSALSAWAYAEAGDIAAARASLEAACAQLKAVTLPAGAAFLHGGHAYVAAARALVSLGDRTAAAALVQPLVAPATTAGWREVMDDCAALIAGARG